MPSSKFTPRQVELGTLLFAGGFAALALAAWDNSSGLPFAMPAFWHNQRTLCLLVALGLSAFGMFVLVNGSTASDVRDGPAWKPTPAGRRFCSLVVYSRVGCHLCEEAIDLLHSYSACLPLVQEIDIDGDPDLRKRFETEVPVVELDGKIRFKGRVSELLLRRLIEGTPPA